MVYLTINVSNVATFYDVKFYSVVQAYFDIISSKKLQNMIKNKKKKYN